MHYLSPEHYSDRGREGLAQFLEEVAAEAQKTSQSQIASIVLSVRHIEPLAVLQSIFEPSEIHAYMEHPQKEYAIAAAEAICNEDHRGGNRFQSMRQTAESWLSHTWCTGDAAPCRKVPRVFFRFNFEEHTFLSSFAPASMFVPRWIVIKDADTHLAVANTLIKPGDDLLPHIERIWGAYQKFQSYEYTQVDTASKWAKQESQNTRSILPALPTGPYYESIVERGLKMLEGGNMRKIVLAQAVDQTISTRELPFRALNRLRERYPTCLTYSWNTNSAENFIGSSPEQLCRIESRTLTSEAIAGSAQRGNTPTEDARIAANLLQSDKNLREHEWVLDAIVSGLQKAGLKPEYSPIPSLRTLPNIQHLYTPVKAPLTKDQHLLDLVGQLHPTPAIAGYPTAEAIQSIRALEPFERGPYAGGIGYCNASGEGVCFVTLRCALLSPPIARLYAGAGIVKGSTPGGERREIEWKLQALQCGLEEHPPE